MIRFVPESPTKTPAKPDYKGAAALSVALAALLLALSDTGGKRPRRSPCSRPGAQRPSRG